MTGRIIFVSEFAILLIALAGVGGRYAVWGWDQWRLKQGRAARAVERARRREQVAAAAAATTAEGDDAPASFVELEEYGDSDNDDDDDDDAAEEDVWEGKSMVLFHLDLTTGPSPPPSNPHPSAFPHLTPTDCYCGHRSRGQTFSSSSSTSPSSSSSSSTPACPSTSSATST